MTQQRFGKATRFILLAVVGYLAAVWYVGWGEIGQALSRVTPAMVLVPLLFSLAAYLLRYLRWHYYLQVFRKHVGIGQALLIYFAGFALTMTPGKVGELFRAAYLKPYRVSYRRGSALFVVERLQDVLAMLALSALALGLLHDSETQYYWIIALMLVALALVLHVRLLLWLRRRLARRPSRVATLLRHLLDVLLHSARLLRLQPFTLGLMLGLLAWFLDAAGFYWISSYYLASADLGVMVGVYTLTVLLGVFSFMPGGVGATEVLMYGFLHLLQVPNDQALVIILLSRLTTLWFAVVLGAGAMTVLGRRPAVAPPRA